jgi:hypothetical protein
VDEFTFDQHTATSSSRLILNTHHLGLFCNLFLCNVVSMHLPNAALLMGLALPAWVSAGYIAACSACDLVDDYLACSCRGAEGNVESHLNLATCFGGGSVQPPASGG